MVILSIDPGTSNLGFAVLEFNDNFIEPTYRDFTVITHGTVHGKKSSTNKVTNEDFANITDAVEILVHEYTPEIVVVEWFGASRRLNKAIVIPMLRQMLISRIISIYPELEIGEIRANDWRRVAIGNDKAEKDECVKKLQMLYPDTDMTNTSVDSVEAIGIGVGYMLMRFNNKNKLKKKLAR